jgi:hypothetical protein
MAMRTNWNTEFTALFACKRLIGRDRTFIESLHRHWSSGKAMTSGRKHHFFIVKERVAQLEARGDDLADKDLAAKLAHLTERAPVGSWDHTFASSLTEQNEVGRALSPRQTEILNKIESRYSDASIEKARAWAGEYDEAKRIAMTRCAKYYHSTTYFIDLVDRVLSDPGFVPTMKQFNAMTSNKYAQKVLAGYEGAPKYATGLTVLPAAGCSWATAQHFKRGAMVVTVDEEIISACKGNRRYKILPIGGMRPLLVEERHIKVRR